MEWPETVDQLVRAQRALAKERSALCRPPGSGLSFGGCFVCFPRGKEGAGAAGDAASAAAALIGPEGAVATAVASGIAGAGYRAGLLALREGPLLEAAVRSLNQVPDVLLVNATGRDHPRGAGLAPIWEPCSVFPRWA